MTVSESKVRGFFGSLELVRLLNSYCFPVNHKFIHIQTCIKRINVPHLSLFGEPSLALLLQSLTSGTDLEAWPDCWVSVEFVAPPIPRKGSGSTTITTNHWFKGCKKHTQRLKGGN